MTNLWDVGTDEDPNAGAAEARLRQSYGINPEQAAKMDALARRAKVPLPAAQAQPDLLGAQVAAADNKRALMNAPATRAFVAADQANADLTHDHVSQIAGIEPKWSLLKTAADTVKGAGGVLSAAALQTSSALWGVLEAAAETPGILEMPGSPVADPVKKYKAALAADIRRQRQFGEATAEGVTPQTGTWWGDAMVSGLLSTVQSGLGIAASVATKNPTPALAGMGTFTAGQEYGKARDAGVEPGRALNYATGQGAFEALTEMIPTGVLLKALKEGKGPLTGMAKTLLAEIPGEQVATLLQDMNEWVTLHPEKSVADFLRERPHAAAETALATLTATGGSVATGYAAQTVMNRVAVRDAQAEQAAPAAQAFDNLVKDTTAMPLRERSPERFKELMDTVADGVDVHVNAGVLNTFLQSLPPEEAATIIEGAGIADQISAATPDADIVIPAGSYLTFVAPDGHTFLQKDIKLGPAALSVNEAEAHKEERTQMLADAAAQALDLGTAEAQAQDPVERVRQHFYDQAIAVGVPDDQARANAAVQAAYYAQRAERNSTYKDAWEAYAAANISMQGRGVTTEGPGGLTTGGAAFDLEQPVYHGTPHEFDEFSLDAIGTGEGAQAFGHGLYFAGNKEVADWYRKTLSGRELPKLDGMDVLKWAERSTEEIRAEAQAVEIELPQVEGITPENMERARTSFGWVAYAHAVTETRLYNGTAEERLAKVAEEAEISGDRELARLEADRKRLGLDAISQRDLAEVATYRLRAAYARALAKSGRLTQSKAGRLLHVEIPEDDTFLAWDQTLADQPKMVEAVNAAAKKLGLEGAQELAEILRDDGDLGAVTGQRAYEKLAEMSSPAEASQALREAGLSGLRYLDGVSRNTKEGHQNYVIFDPTHARITAFEQRQGQGPRGQVSISEQGNLIQLFKSRNASTLVHEAAGHIWLENLARDAADPNASDDVRADLETIKNWWRENAALAGHEPAALKAIEDFGVTKVDTDAIRPFHELFARAAERYFMEGKSPTPELRSHFAKFRQWLVSIYKDFTKLRVPMTDDVRGVFDRLIAGQQAMTETIVEQKLEPFFPDAASAGMTDAEYAAYLKTIQTAHEAAEDRLLGRMLADVRRKYTEAWKTERAALVEDFQAQVNETPEMQALAALESGDVRLAREFVGDETTLYRRQRPYVFDEGVHPDVLAEQVGLSSGEALLASLRSMKEEHDALRETGDKRTVRVARAEALADAEMLARHGDVLHDGTIGDEALAALHDVRRSEALAAEVRALVRKAGATTLIWTEHEMRAWAERQIGLRQLNGIRPHVYAAAEAKAGRDALKALIKDDFQAALDAKFRQLLNMHLYRVARDARDGIEKGKTLFERIAKAKNGAISKSRNMDMVGAARQIISAYGYEAAANDADYMAKVAAYDPELYDDLRDTITAALAGAKPVDDLNLDEFSSLREAVEQLWVMSRTSRQMQGEFETLELEDIANDLANGLGNVAPRANTRAPTNTEHALRIVAGFRAALRRVEAWVEGIDGGTKGPWRTYIWQPVSEAATRFRTAKAQYLERFVALLEPIQGTLKRGKIEAPELGYTFGFANSGVGKSELLHALLHTGNDSNKRKLLLGRGWALEQADGTLDTSAWDRFLDRMHREGVLTEADWTFAQSVWDLLEEMKPDAQRAHRAVFGRYFEEVTANPVVTPFGTFKGGYVPAITDTFLVQEQALNAQADQITDANDASMFPSPARGFTKARVEYNKPLMLDLGLLPGHIDKVLKFTHMTAPVRDVLRLLKEKGLSAKLEAFDATAVPDLLLPWLNRSAKQIVETPTKGNAGRGFDNFFRAVRHRTGMGIMIANVSNTMQQLTGWAPAALKVRKRNLVRGLWQVTRDPAGMATAIAAMSPYMASRTTATVQEASGRIERLLMDPSKFQKVSDFSQRHAYVMQSITQNLVDTVTWSAAFEEGLERGEDLPEAVRSADAVVRQTQGSLAPEDVSRFEVGPPVLRMFTQFYSYFNVQGNLLATEFGNSRNLTRGTYVYIMGIAAPAILADMIRRSFGEGWDDDDDDGYLDTFLDVFFGSQFRYITGGIPIAGQIISSVAARFNKKPYDDKLVPAPAISTVEQLVGLPKDVWKATTEGKRQKAAVRETATLLTLLTGVPLFAAAGRPLGYLADVNEGKVEPTGPVDFARGLVTGTASNESKVQ